MLVFILQVILQRQLKEKDMKIVEQEATIQHLQSAIVQKDAKILEQENTIRQLQERRQEQLMLQNQSANLQVYLQFSNFPNEN